MRTLFRKFRFALPCLLCAVVFPNATHSQTRDDKNTEIEIGYGPVYPMGDFGSTDPTDSLASFAIRGTRISGSVLYLFSKYAGAMFRVSHAGNRVDEAILREKYKSLAASLNGDISALTSDRWKYTSYAAGPCFAIQLRNVSFDVHVLAGVTNATLPETEITIYDSTQTNALQVVMESAPSSAFGFEAAAGVRYFVSDLMLISLHGSYFTSRQKFKGVTTETNFSDDESHDYERKISAVNVILGIGFRF